ncbi:hypothetical protein GC106_59570 [Kibdelosporangium sp. 4NS15]|uniref:Uncharacterized protein n=1 Tax=Kibdelosporangium persicum TaxID=2698649 RepID=A0ABX2FBG1_9PSEU|nr:hypothetical protein [Kibdelosporangium persicum]
MWTNGEQFLVMDRYFLYAWKGDEAQVDALAELHWSVTATEVGTGMAAVVAIDGTVNDVGWLEVFQNRTGIAIVQALGEPYERALGKALAYPIDGDHVGGDIVPVPSGNMYFFSAVLNGDCVWPKAKPGKAPVHWEPAGVPAPSGLRFDVPRGDYQLQVRWMTQPDEDTCFARWLFCPAFT